MPYTAMAVGALQMGISHEDLRHMPLRRLQWYIHVNNSMNAAPKQEPKYREGTIAELKKIL